MAAGSSTRPPDEGGSPSLAAADVKRVRAVLVLGGVPFDEIDDSVQQVQLKLLEEQARHGPPHIRNVSAWLQVVASRVAADWHRTRVRETSLCERLTARWARHPPADLPEEDRVLALAVADEMEHLAANQRQVLTLRFYADLPVKEIALLLSVPEGTIKSRLHTAVAALRARLYEREVI